VIVLLVGIVAAILLPAIAKHRESKRRWVCVDNLKQLARALYLYVNENNERFPPIDDTRNNFTFDANLLYPEYLTDHMVAMCPGDPQRDQDTNFRLISDHSADGTQKGEVHPDCFTDDSYIYLGWMVMTDKEVEAFFEAYDKLSAEDYDADIIVPAGWGTLEGDTIHRLSIGVDRFSYTDINAIGSRQVGASTVPIAWEIPSSDMAKSNHRHGNIVGGHVLYMDGFVSFYKFGEEFPHRYIYSPINKTTARLLDERPREAIPGCD
jgi:hypothetical protein